MSVFIDVTPCLGLHEWTHQHLNEHAGEMPLDLFAAHWLNVQTFCGLEAVDPLQVDFAHKVSPKRTRLGTFMPVTLHVDVLHIYPDTAAQCLLPLISGSPRLFRNLGSDYTTAQSRPQFTVAYQNRDFIW